LRRSFGSQSLVNGSVGLRPALCRDELFSIFQEPQGIETLVPSCTDQQQTGFINTINEANQLGTTFTNKSFFFLSELESIIGPAEQTLPCFFKAICNAQDETELGTITLVIDRSCTLSEPIIVPPRFTLAGVGINGKGQLGFSGLADGVSAVQFAQGITTPGQARKITIRDLSIGYVGGGQNIGIDVSFANMVYIRNVQVSDFFAGILGSRPNTHAMSVYIDHCSVFNNSWNIVIHSNAFHWRIRDCILNGARCWGLRIFGPGSGTAGVSGVGNDHLISGCRIERCELGGALVGSDSAMFMNNRFEGNGMDAGNRGILIHKTARRTRLVSNYFSNNTILDSSVGGIGNQRTQEWGSIFV
jgi:hypothetical protein